MKDLFQAAKEIQKIDPKSLHTGYKLVSLDVVSLFTNVLLKRTINIIKDRIYKEKRYTLNYESRLLRSWWLIVALRQHSASTIDCTTRLMKCSWDLL